MYKSLIIANTITRGEVMKKTLEIMLIGMGAGIGLTKLYDMNKGKINKTINDTLDKMKM